MEDVPSDGDGGEPGFPDVIADDNHIHQIVDCLKSIGKEKRKGEAQQLSGNRTRRQIADHR